MGSGFTPIDLVAAGDAPEAAALDAPREDLEDDEREDVGDDEPSLASPEQHFCSTWSSGRAYISRRLEDDQTRWAAGASYDGEAVNENGDTPDNGEHDTADEEPRLGSLEHVDQARRADGDGGSGSTRRIGHADSDEVTFPPKPPPGKSLWHPHDYNGMLVMGWVS